MKSKRLLASNFHCFLLFIYFLFSFSIFTIKGKHDTCLPLDLEAAANEGWNVRDGRVHRRTSCLCTTEQRLCEFYTFYMKPKHKTQSLVLVFIWIPVGVVRIQTVMIWLWFIVWLCLSVLQHTVCLYDPLYEINILLMMKTGGIKTQANYRQ